MKKLSNERSGEEWRGQDRRRAMERKKQLIFKNGLWEKVARLEGKHPITKLKAK
jgi:hypothetical protein